MFQAEYSSGQPLRMLVDLRAAIDDALGRSVGSAPASAKKVAPAAKSAAAAGKPSATGGAGAKAAAKFNVTENSAPEFEISIGADEWNPDTSGGQHGK